MDISTINKRTYREHIGIVLQEPVLFKGTIASNIKFGKDVPDEEDPEYEDIDDLIEENSLLILENESLNNEIKYLRAELERVTKLKDVLLQAASEASAALTAPLAEFFIGKGELK